jgi:hypothetical protein
MAATRAVPWYWRPAAALAVALAPALPEAVPETPALALEPVPVAVAPAVPVAEPEVAVAVMKPELAVTLEISAGISQLNFNVLLNVMRQVASKDLVVYVGISDVSMLGGVW